MKALRFRLFWLPLFLALAALLALTSPAHAEGEAPEAPTAVESISTTVVSDEGGGIDVGETATSEALGQETAGAEEEPSLEGENEALTGQDQAEEGALTAPPSDPGSTEIPVEGNEPEGEGQDGAVDDTLPESGAEVNLSETATALEELNLTLEDSSGEAISLAGEQAAAALANPAADPWFISGGITYRFMTNCAAFPGDPNCFESAQPIQAAINYIRDHDVVPTDGAIHVDAGFYDENVTIDGTWANMSGLKGLYGAGSDPVTGTFLDGSITLYNLLSGFTLSGFYIKDSTGSANALVNIYNSAGTLTLIDLAITNLGSGEGLNVANHNGAIVLTGVDVSDSPNNNGAHLDNTASNNAGITITNSSFDHNGSSSTRKTGLLVNSNGLVIFNGVSASQNSGDGASVTSRGLTARNSVFNQNDDANSANTAGNGLVYQPRPGMVGNVTLESVHFRGNERNGLLALVNGNLTLKDVRADENGISGVSLNTCNWDGTVCLHSGAGNISITSSSFERNARKANGYGLHISDAKGSITLNDVWAANNGSVATFSSIGAFLYNQHSPTLRPVSVTASGFNGNYGSGLLVYSMGQITLKDTEASGNQNNGMGAMLRNDIAGAKAGVSLLASAGKGNTFSNNASSTGGLVVHSNGNIQLNRVWAEGNSNGYGASLDNTTGSGSVTVTTGWFNQNQYTGLNVISNGAININLRDGGASQNLSGQGLILDNSGAPSPKAVTVDGGAYEQNVGTGIWIISKGAITLRNLNSSYNTSGYGAFLDNNEAGAKGGVTITATLANWLNNFVGNLYGLWIDTLGAVTISRSNVDQNLSYGANIRNQNGSGNITISNSSFSENSSGATIHGLSVTANGAITLNGVRVNLNGNATYASGGALLNNQDGVTVRPITITNSSFNQNYGEGLNAFSKGAITLTNGEASSNKLRGANISNAAASTPVAITLTNAQFNSNEGAFGGLTVSSLGNITLRNVSAGGNTNGFGAVVDNYYSNAGKGNILISGPASYSWFGDNGNYGLQVLSNGSITVSNVNVCGNGTSGGYFDNKEAVAPKPISISNANFNENASGLEAYSQGNITLKNVDAGGNQGGAGVYLKNDYSGSSGSVTISGSGNWDWFGANNSYGLWVLSHGKITISKINASDNQSYGVRLDNYDAPSAQAVSLSFIEISRNNQTVDGTALTINSKGNITLINVTVNGNGVGDTVMGSGAMLNNLYGPSGSVMITNSVFNENNQNAGGSGGNGLSVYSNGSITFRNVSAVQNQGYGAYLDNSSGSAAAGVNISTTGAAMNWFMRNDDSGLTITTSGPVTLTNLQVCGNGDLVNREDGLNVNNTYGTSAVTIRNVVVSGNHGYGMYVSSKGQISLSNLEANSNGSDGVSVYNAGASEARNITASNLRASGNANGGFVAVSKGDVMLSNSIAIGNQNGAGVLVDNRPGSGSVQISGKNVFSGNKGSGLEIYTIGKVSLANITAEYNRGSQGGIYVNGITADGSQSVTLTNINSHGNDNHGVKVVYNGVIDLNKVSAFNNGWGNNADGAHLISYHNDITVRDGFFSGNEGSGIYAQVGTAVLDIINTAVFGNDADNSGDKNVRIG